MVNQQPAQPQRQQAPFQPAPQPNYSAPTAPTQDEFLSDPAGATQRYMQYVQQTQFDPWAQQTSSNMAGMARELVRRDEARAFDRWGPEIDTLIRQVDPRYLTVETVRKIVGMVKADHIEELAEERARERLAKMPQTVRADGSSGTPAQSPALDLQQAGLPDEYSRTLSKYNVTPKVLDEFLTNTECRVRGVPLEQARKEWLEKAKKGDILTEAPIRTGPDLNPSHTGEKAVPLA